MVYIILECFKLLELFYLFFHLAVAIYNQLRFLASSNAYFIPLYEIKYSIQEWTKKFVEDSL